MEYIKIIYKMNLKQDNKPPQEVNNDINSERAAQN